MLDWLEHILSILTAAQQEEDELNEWLIPHPLILPLKQAAQNNTAEDIPVDIPPALRPTALRDIPQQAARRNGEQTLSLPDTALPLLYRRTEEAVSRTAAAGLAGTSAAGQARVITVQEGDSGPVGLTVQEFDRAIRRDSRRFDGGMNLY